MCCKLRTDESLEIAYFRHFLNCWTPMLYLVPRGWLCFSRKAQQRGSGSQHTPRSGHCQELSRGTPLHSDQSGKPYFLSFFPAPALLHWRRAVVIDSTNGVPIGKYKLEKWKTRRRLVGEGTQQNEQIKLSRNVFCWGMCNLVSLSFCVVSYSLQ